MEPSIEELTNMFRIGEFSKMTKTTIKTLRYYDEMGLLRPAQVDEDNGYRYYTTAQLVPLHRIVALRQTGLTISEVAAILSGGDVPSILQARRSELESSLLETQAQLAKIDYILTHSKEDFFMKYQAILKELPQCTVYYVQKRLPNLSDFSSFIPESRRAFRDGNPETAFAQPEYCYVTYTDPEFKHTDVGVEFGQAVAKAGKDTETVKFKQLARSQAVCVMHKGAYEGLGEAYSFAYSWLEENGYVPVEKAREQYIAGPWDQTPQEEWLTEIQIPVRKKQ